MKSAAAPAIKPKLKPIDMDDLQSLYDSAAPPTTARTTVRGRRAKEKKRGIKSTDGRGHKSKGRERQFNTNVTPDMFERVDDVCERFDLTKAEFTELAFKAAMMLLKSSGVQALQSAGDGLDAK